MNNQVAIAKVGTAPGKWVQTKLLLPLFGYSAEAAKKKRYDGVWLEGLHWLRAPDGNYFYNPTEIEKWIEGQL